MGSDQSNDILTLKEACKFLKVSESTTRRWLREKKIPAHKTYGHWRFLKSELTDWVKEH